MMRRSNVGGRAGVPQAGSLLHRPWHGAAEKALSSMRGLSAVKRRSLSQSLLTLLEYRGSIRKKDPKKMGILKMYQFAGVDIPKNITRLSDVQLDGLLERIAVAELGSHFHPKAQKMAAGQVVIINPNSPAGSRALALWRRFLLGLTSGSRPISEKGKLPKKH